MYKRKVRGWSQHIDFILLDNLCVLLSLFVGFMLVKRNAVLTSRFFWMMGMEAILVNTVVVIVLDTYHSVLHHSPWEEMVRLLAQTGHVVLILLAFQLFPGIHLMLFFWYQMHLRSAVYDIPDIRQDYI